MYDGEYRVCMVHFPTGDVTGAIREDSDGFITIYIDDQLSPEARLSKFLHEIKHMFNDDLHNSKDIREAEGE